MGRHTSRIRLSSPCRNNSKQIPTQHRHQHMYRLHRRPSLEPGMVTLLNLLWEAAMQRSHKQNSHAMGKLILQLPHRRRRKMVRCRANITRSMESANRSHHHRSLASHLMAYQTSVDELPLFIPPTSHNTNPNRATFNLRPRLQLHRCHSSITPPKLTRVTPSQGLQSLAPARNRRRRGSLTSFPQAKRSVWA